jgi:hypothetical protein
VNEILKPWYAVATPHQDIRKGGLEEAVFAANIWAVVRILLRKSISIPNC